MRVWPGKGPWQASRFRAPRLSTQPPSTAVAVVTPVVSSTPPGEFIRLDATMSDADAYNNVRDLQVRLANHNVLLARRVRQPMFTLGMHDDSDFRDPITFKALGTIGDMALQQTSPAMVLRVPIWVPPWCQAAELVGRMVARTGGGPSVPCYGKIDTPTQTTNPPSSATFTATTSIGRFAGEVVVPPDAARQGMALFSFFIDGQIFGSDIKGTGVAEVRDVGVDSGRPYIDADLEGSNTGNALYVESRLEIYPRLVVENYNIGTAALNGTANTWRCYLDQPFNISPTPGVDFANTRLVQALDLRSLSLWPKAISDFDEGVELP